MNNIFKITDYFSRWSEKKKTEKIKFIFFLSDIDYYSVVCYDLFQREDCFIDQSRFQPDKNMFLFRLLRMFRFPEKVIAFFHKHFPFRSFFYPCLPVIKDPDKTILVFYQMFMGAYDHRFREYLENQCKPESSFLILTNPLACSANMPSGKTLKDRFDFILSDDISDCRENGFLYWEDNYSRIEIPEEEQIRSDVFFVGSSKGRLSVLHKLYALFQEKGIKAVFFITDVPKEQQIFKGIFYNTKIPYQRVLQYVSGCKVILEVVQTNQKGLTLRTQEALTYQKKLLTNNPFIKEKEYYSPPNIQFFSEPEEIDLDWLLKNDFSPYVNTPDFSAVRLLDFIKTLTGKNKKRILS